MTMDTLLALNESARHELDTILTSKLFALSYQLFKIVTMGTQYCIFSDVQNRL